ncbi:MAG: BamA/TamA family outer membrane protein, partial [Salinibacter sp.]
TLGSENFVTARADLRRYLYAEPFTFAFQALHVGNYGAEFSNEFGVGGIGNEYIGYPYSQGFVRGYSVQSISEGIRAKGADRTCSRVGDNPTVTEQCAEIDRLFGTRALTTRAEIRVPFLGPERLSLLPFRYVPTTLALFADAGITWTESQAPRFTFETNSSATNIPVVSTGVAARFNILGSILLEAYYARPFQRRDTTWELGFRISPGF